MEKFQSGFRSRHSTESALLTVFNDLILTVDSGCAAIMVTLDLTAAFDTVDHRTLLSRLEQYAGIKGAALTLLQSYLTDRSFSVNLGDFSSSLTSLTCGVPQGSILGPLLFSLYMLPLGSILRKHNMSFHCYADDVQIYVPLQMNCKDSVQSLLACITDIKTWMRHSFLNLNDSVEGVCGVCVVDGWFTASPGLSQTDWTLAGWGCTPVVHEQSWHPG